jgi:hypothetical protein
MSHYFIAGNMWLFAAAVVFWGQEFTPATSGMVSGYQEWRLFGIGRTFYAYQYPWLLGALIVIAATCFALHFHCSRKPASEDCV